MNPFVQPTETQPGENLSPDAWLESQLSAERPFLLAFADDGVIWGKKMDGKLVPSHEIDGSISPALREETLQQAFVFGEKDEVRLFKDEAGQWKSLRIVDGATVIVESQILWGDRAYETQNGFTRVFDARQQGLDHIVPLIVDNARIDPDMNGNAGVRLDVHHMVEYDEETGEARIVLSRLAGLRIGKKDEEVKK